MKLRHHEGVDSHRQNMEDEEFKDSHEGSRVNVSIYIHLEYWQMSSFILMEMYVFFINLILLFNNSGEATRSRACC